MAKKTYSEIQNEVIKKYRIDICDGTKCSNDWSRTHAHVKQRRVCKWKRANSVQSTFTLLHEIGHIETTKSAMRRCESEFYATVWAIERCKEYGIELPQSTLQAYQDYIDDELARGLRRGGTGYKESYNIFAYDDAAVKYVNTNTEIKEKKTVKKNQSSKEKKVPVDTSNSVHKVFICFGRSKIGYIKKYVGSGVSMSVDNTIKIALEYADKESAAMVEVWHRCNDNWSKLELEYVYHNPKANIQSDDFIAAF